ncbi:MAG: hypothetical protein ACI4L8_12940, partial [Candidatus Fimadaptatus sp.]
MSYSEDNNSGKPAEIEYSTRSRRRAQPEGEAAPAEGPYRRRGNVVPLPGAGAAAAPEQEQTVGRRD